VNRTIGGLAMT